MAPSDPLESLDTRVSRYILAALVASAVAVGALVAYSCHQSSAKGAAVTQADTLRTSAAAQAAQGAVYDTQELAQARHTATAARAAQEDAAAVQVARDALARVRGAYPGPDPAAPPAGDADRLVPVPPAVDVASVVPAQDALIAALTKENGDLKTVVASQAVEIATLTLSRDAWRGAAGASAAEAVQLRAALAAQEGLIRAAEIKYGLGGFLLGYGAGRAKR